MLTLSPSDVRAALDLSRPPIVRRLAGLPFHRASARKRYWIVDVLPRLKPQDRCQLQALFDRPTELNGDGAAELELARPLPSRARDLEAWFDTLQTERLLHARLAYAEALAEAFASNALMAFHERSRLILPLHDEVLRWVTVGDAEPNWNALAPAWAIATATYEPINEVAA